MEATAFSKATKAGQGRATTLGHTTGNLQTSSQEKETTSGYSATEAAQRPREDGSEIQGSGRPSDTQIQAQLVNSDGPGYSPVHPGPSDWPLSWIPSL